MKTRSIIISIAVAAIGLLLAGCEQENGQPETNQNENGQQEKIGSISVSATAPMDDITIATKATEASETRLESLALVLVPKAGGGAIVVDRVELSDPVQVSPTHYTYNATFTFPDGEGEVYKGEYYLYAIGNPGKQYVAFNADDLKGKTKEQIDSWIVTKANAEPDFSESGLLMTGRYGTGDGSVTLASFDNKLTDVIGLSRIVSKSTFTFVNGSSTGHTNVKFVPISYSIYNYSLSTSLVERAGWNGADPGSLGFCGQESQFASRENIPVPKSGVFSFYMPENVQTTYPATPDSWDYKKRELRKDMVDNNFTNPALHAQFAYAPANATYVVVKGDYSDDNYTGVVEYTIHLGDFTKDVKNFSVRRNYRYNYKITVNGVKNIIAEARAVSNTDPFQPGAEGDIVAVPKNERVFNVDAHYEQVMISFDKPSTGSTFGIMAETPFSGGRVIDAGNNPIADPSVYNWVKFAKPEKNTISSWFGSRTSIDFPATSPNFTATGGSKKWATIYEFINDVKSGSGTYYLEYGGKIYVAAYVDEYFYTGQPVSSFVNTNPRTLQTTLSTVDVSLDHHSTYSGNVIFKISQNSIKVNQKIEALEVPFGFERTEETVPSCGDSKPNSGDNVGYPSLKGGRDELNGWTNFRGWFTESSWSTYVNMPKNGLNLGTSGSRMQSSYDLGWYQCMSRNRDENGNGIIDESEVKWYLPAVRQYLTIMFASHDFFDEFVNGVGNPLYLTSTSGISGKRVWWAAEGVAFGSFGANWWNNWNLSIRCVRTLGSDNAAPSPTYSYNSTRREFEFTGFNDDVMRTTTMTGGYDSHDLSNAEILRLPTKFVVASKNIQNAQGRDVRFVKDEVNGATDLCAAKYSEPGYPVGTWRIPNAKEFCVMALESGILDSGTACRTISKYINVGGEYVQNGTTPIFYVNGVVTTGQSNNPFNNGGGALIRCVRDVR